MRDIDQKFPHQQSNQCNLWYEVLAVTWESQLGQRPSPAPWPGWPASARPGACRLLPSCEVTARQWGAAVSVSSVRSGLITTTAHQLSVPSQLCCYLLFCSWWPADRPHNTNNNHNKLSWLKKSSACHWPFMMLLRATLFVVCWVKADKQQTALSIDLTNKTLPFLS